jgi:hypothetical protein
MARKTKIENVVKADKNLGYEYSWKLVKTTEYEIAAKM